MSGNSGNVVCDVAYRQEGDTRVFGVQGPARIEVDDDGTVSVFTPSGVVTSQPIGGGCPLLPEAA